MNSFIFNGPTPSLFNLAGGHGVGLYWFFFPSAASIRFA